MTQMTSTREQARDERRETILDFLVVNDGQPVTYDEIAYACSINPGTVNADLLALAEAGLVFARTETDEERFIRYDAVAKGKNSTLYSVYPHVPAREFREVVPGYVATPHTEVTRLSPVKVNRRLAGIFKVNSGRWKFTYEKLGRLAKVSSDTVAARVRDFEARGLVRRTGTFDGGKTVFQVVDKDAILADLSPQGELFTPPATPAVPKPSPETGNVFNALRELRQRAEAEVAELPSLLAQRAELDNRIAYLTKLRDELGLS